MSAGFDASNRRLGRRRAVAASAVAGAHLAVLIAVWQWKLVTPRGSEPPRSIAIRLLPERVEPRKKEKADAPAARDRAAPVTPASALPAVAEPIRSIVAPLPSPADEAPAATVPATATAPAGARVGLDGAAAGGPGVAASGSPASGLALAPSREVMRGALANPAVNDPRSNSPRPTFEERFAMGLDPTLCLKVERLPDGTIKRSLKHAVEVQSTMSATHGARTKAIRSCP